MTGLMMVVGSSFQAIDGFSGHPNDHDLGVDEEDWFNNEFQSVDNTKMENDTYESFDPFVVTERQNAQ
nr:hypothetical protein [Tanacetum cinerariifolium]